jgi:ABC-type Fe3+-hydroxamate transport system substrate-binding protein
MNATVDGKDAKVKTDQPELIKAPPRTLGEWMNLLSRAQQKVADYKRIVAEAGKDLKDARADLDHAVEMALHAFATNAPAGQLSLEAAKRIQEAANDGD